MIKLKNCLLLFLLVPIISFAQVNDDNSFFDGSYDKKYIVNNRIEKIHRSSLVQQSLSQSVYYFSDAGILTRLVFLDTAAKIKNEYLFEYNKEGDLIRRKNIDRELNKTYVADFTREYSNGLLIRFSGSDMPSYEYLYNEQKQKIRTTEVLFPGTAAMTKINTDYFYDPKNNLLKEIRETSYTANDTTGHITSHRLLSYSKSGKPEKEEELVTNDNPLVFLNYGTITYTYDDNGNLTSLKRTAGFSSSFNYDKNLLRSKTVVVTIDNHTTEISDNYLYKMRK